MSDTTSRQTSEAAHQQGDEDPDRDQIRRMREALVFISRPTMGLPPGVDPAVWVKSGAHARDVRQALMTCIQLARQALR